MFKRFISLLLIATMLFTTWGVGINTSAYSSISPPSVITKATDSNENSQTNEVNNAIANGVQFAYYFDIMDVKENQSSLATCADIEGAIKKIYTSLNDVYDRKFSNPEVYTWGDEEEINLINIKNRLSKLPNEMLSDFIKYVKTNGGLKDDSALNRAQAAYVMSNYFLWMLKFDLKVLKLNFTEIDEEVTTNGEEQKDNTNIKNIYQIAKYGKYIIWMVYEKVGDIKFSTDNQPVTANKNGYRMFFTDIFEVNGTNSTNGSCNVPTLPDLKSFKFIISKNYNLDKNKNIKESNTNKNSGVSAPLKLRVKIKLPPWESILQNLTKVTSDTKNVKQISTYGFDDSTINGKNTMIVLNNNDEETDTEAEVKLNVIVHQKGDVDLDGRISIKDANYIQRYSSVLSEERFEQADINCNHKVDNEDVMLIQYYLVNTIDIKTYTIYFNGNGATSGTMKRQIITNGCNEQLISNLFKKKGYEFTGWNEQLSKNQFKKAGYEFAGWNVFRVSDGKWFYGKDGCWDWYTANRANELGLSKILLKDCEEWDGFSEDEEYICYAQWKKFYIHLPALLKTTSDIKTTIGGKTCKFTTAEGIAVDSTYVYSTKVDSTNKRVAITRTNISTKTQTTLGYFSGLGIANDMTVLSVNGKRTLFVATNDTSCYSILKLQINGNRANIVGRYNLYYNNNKYCPAGISYYSHTNGRVYFYATSGHDLFTFSIADNKNSGNITMGKKCTLNKTEAYINGAKRNVISYSKQGIYYNSSQDTLYVPLKSETDNTSVILAYRDFSKASGTVYAKSSLSFEAKGEMIQACGISSDGRLYFNVNRANNGDAILYFKDYKI